MGLIGTVLRGVVALMVVVGLALGAGFATGFLGVPSAGVVDVGEWGEVTEDQTEIVTTLWVDNPNPIGVSIGSGLKADYEVSMNDVKVADGQKQGIDVASGNNTVELRTYVDNEQLQPWWVEYVRANETIHLSASGSATVDAGFESVTVQFPSMEETMQEDSAPIIESLSAAASEAEGSYGPYEVRRAYAEWASVNESTTTVHFVYEIHNSGPTHVPAVPKGFEVDVQMNDVAMFEGGTGAMTPKNVAENATIAPGETQELVFAVQMDNEKVDDWFRSHVGNDELTHVEADVQFVFEVGDVTFRIPPDGATYECDFQTAMLIEQQDRTDCGDGGSAGAGHASLAPAAAPRP
ncbi:hypothetical protein BRC81_07240 [Halobacteriales archaeon QS_1_68_20]|nr:MAG: hypothetical protein BRC81_07240 [Halobacteriales archaeon QS_1_68_20]